MYIAVHRGKVMHLFEVDRFIADSITSQNIRLIKVLYFVYMLSCSIDDRKTGINNLTLITLEQGIIYNMYVWDNPYVLHGTHCQNVCNSFKATTV